MRLSGKQEKLWRKMILADGGALTIGLSGLADLESGTAALGSLSVAMERNGIVLQLSPKQAREMASRFDTPEATAAGVAWIGQTLREVADEIASKVQQHN